LTFGLDLGILVMMDRLSFEKGELREFIKAAEIKLSLGSEELGPLLGISGRTLRDWKREKFKPNKNKIFKLSKLSGVKIPDHKVISEYWNSSNAGKLGGKRVYELYGLLGTYQSRSKGGVMSWYSRKKDPELLKKYTNQFRKPRKSKDFAEFIGIMLGDGGLTFAQCTIYLNSETDQKFSEYTRDLIKKLFDLTPSIHKHRKSKMVMVSISSINLVKYLTLNVLPVGNKVRLQVGVPKWIWSKPEYIKACIRGLIDTDGCFTVHKYKVNGKGYSYPKIAFKNSSEPILDFVYNGLIHLGFNPKRTFKNHVWLYSQLEVKRYLREIGTKNYKPQVLRIIQGEVA
jgi:hypothetical protein